jgi:hypothetical protein
MPEQVRGLLEQAGGLVETLDRSDPALRAQLCEELGIGGTYDPNSHTVHVKASAWPPAIQQRLEVVV